MFIERKTLLGAVLMAAPVLLGVSGQASASVLINEDFATTHQYWIWESGSDGDGDVGYSRDAQSLELRGATTMGATTWIRTVRQYDTSSGALLTLDVRCAPGAAPMGPHDAAFWGFQRTIGSADYSVGFRADWIDGDGPALLASAHAGAQTAESRITFADWSELTDYRVEVQEGVARFYVNGSLVWTVGGASVPQGLLDVRIEKESPGRAQLLSVDSVRLEENWVRGRIVRGTEGPEADGALRMGDDLPSDPGGVTESSWGGIKSAYRD
jgi:hypothetical protein